MLASTSLREEGVEGVVAATYCFITGHLTIWLNAVLKAEELPARIANLDAGLSNVNAKCFAHGSWLEQGRGGLLKGRIEEG
jgi:hypothetical protein